MNIQVIDDFLSKANQDGVEEKLTTVNFPWYLSKESVKKENPNGFFDINTVDSDYFFHLFIADNKENSAWASMIEVFKEKIAAQNVDVSFALNVRANFTYHCNRYGDDQYRPAHRDYAVPSVTCIYYVNDSDGDTLFFECPPDGWNGTSGLKQTARISPKKGRMVIFDNSFIHSSVPPKKCDRRIVINFNYRKDLT